MVQGGIKLPEINIGNMHFHEGRVVVNKYINVDKSDMAAFNILRDHGSVSTIQHMPESDKECILK
nr:PTS sugar transporter subunit IIB [Vibrio taketomensis]